MSLIQILILAGVAIILNRIKQGRSFALLLVSGLVMYWLQPDQEPVNLMYWFPTLTLGLAAVSWALTSPPEVRNFKDNFPAVLLLTGVTLFMGLNRHLQLEQLFVVETPRLHWVILAAGVFFAISFVLLRLTASRHAVLIVMAAALVALLGVLKFPSAGERLYDLIAGWRGKDQGGVSGLTWLGFSYVSFRLLHTIFDRLSGRLPPVSLAEYVNYIIFFPAFTAGPIDRIERFARDLKEPIELGTNGWVEAGSRLASGLFKKFVLADGLAWIALNNVYARSLEFPGPSWILLYAYSLRIFFDFSGYTDIAIGLGRLMGVRLPENFNSPYLKPNITQFWSSWHMTLTQWFRGYYFNPLTRAMRTSRRRLPDLLMVLLAQVSTMVLIGLWHGITAGFLLWGLWHGVGLFIHNRWSNWARPRIERLNSSPIWEAGLRFSGIVVTFNFVSLGWVFFNLQEPEMAWQTILFLFGAA